MVAKVWHIEDIKRHLRSVKSAIKTSVPALFVDDGDGCAKIYLEGSEAAIDYLAERFGVKINDNNLSKKPPTGELRLRTWNKQDIKRNLENAWIILLSTPIETDPKNRKLQSYYQGIEKALTFLAYSFNIDRIGPSKVTN